MAALDTAKATLGAHNAEEAELHFGLQLFLLPAQHNADLVACERVSMIAMMEYALAAVCQMWHTAGDLVSCPELTWPRCPGQHANILLEPSIHA